MPRYALVLSYDGGKFAGWQIQPGCVTVQGVLTDALTLLNGGVAVRVDGAGRTDAGVHAFGQVAACSLEKTWESSKLLLALNANLPAGAVVRSVLPVSPSFDPRGQAQWRWYRYFVWQGQGCPPQLQPYVWWRKASFWDFGAVTAWWKCYEGEHDFSAFCKTSECPENPRRRMLSLQTARRGNLLCFSVRGYSFLTHMVRSMVGTLDDLSRGHKSDEDLAALLRGAPRSEGGLTAPAQGLFFWRVGYRKKNR